MISRPLQAVVSKVSLILYFLNVFCLVLCINIFLSADFQISWEVISLIIVGTTLSIVENVMISHLLHDSHPSVAIETKFIFKICIFNSEQMCQ